MSENATSNLEQTIRAQYRLWNEGKREELDALFESWAPAGFTIEYIGAPPIEGRQAMNEMWATYGGHFQTEPIEVIVNGNEGAAYVANRANTEQGSVTMPSLETYKVADGHLTIRYYHRSEA